MTKSEESAQRIRDVLAVHGRLPAGVATLSDDDDLFQAGMTSHASVNVMLALEDAFDVEFPESRTPDMARLAMGQNPGHEPGDFVKVLVTDSWGVGGGRRGSHELSHGRGGELLGDQGELGSMSGVLESMLRKSTFTSIGALRRALDALDHVGVSA